MGESSDYRIPVICGPTGSGKTSCAVNLSEHFPLEIVNADSRQIIKHLDIGTAKPTTEECNKVPFHLVDIVEPGDRYSAFRFIHDAENAILSVRERDRIPIVAGGTGLYLKALAEGVVEITESDMEIRNRLEQEMDRLGPEAMHDRLSQVDPLEAARVHPNNRIRVVRALELFELTGKCKSELVETEAYVKPNFRYEFFCLQPPRELLYQRINERVDQMMAAGLLAELQGLVKAGMRDSIRKSKVIGYDELLDFLEGKRTLEESRALIKQNSRRYAKRQMTWFRWQSDGKTFEDSAALEAAVSQELRLIAQT